MANHRQTSWTIERKRKFLANLAKTGNVTTAARLCGSSRSRAYQTRDEDPGFAQSWKAALKEAADNLEAEAWRRAVDGVDEPVFYMGAECGVVRKYSDSLLTLLLKHAKRNKYMERSERTLSGKLEVQHSKKAADMTDDELAEIAAAKGAK